MKNILNHLEDDDLDYVQDATPYTTTENGAVAWKSTSSAVLDFFAIGGAIRDRSDADVISVFNKAFHENPLLAVKALFYFRDVRGGQGERKTFRTLLTWLAETHPAVVSQNIGLIAEYGRWDDAFVLLGTELENKLFGLIDRQLRADAGSKTPSLLAKWLPSENASSKESKFRARRIRKALGLSSKQYRQTLSELRAKIGLVEQKMSNNDWSEIQYNKIPSKAGLQYRTAFYRHDHDRYSQFIQRVVDGEETVNAGTLYPYEIVEKTGATSYRHGSGEDDSTLDAMWKNLPDYFGDQEVRGIVVADVSGSMRGRPLDVSISLAIYAAQRNNGAFGNQFITFSRRPKLQKLKGDTITEIVRSLINADWDMNTDIEAVFDLLLNTAVKNELKQTQMPTHLYIVSDMEFDDATTDGWGERCRDNAPTKTLFQQIRAKWEAKGYEMPMLVFWNVYSRNNQQPMSLDERGFQMVSGCSPSIFKSLLANKQSSAYDMMLEVLNDERYKAITVE